VAGAPVVVRWSGRGIEGEKSLPSTDTDGRTSSSWRDADAAPGEIVNVLATALEGEVYGLALLQYAYGFPPNP